MHSSYVPFVQVWLEAGKKGFLATDTPADVGGIGGEFLHAAIVREEQ
jgi:alkylation response protein AidB-like acyl-CoA dehydrogenase